MYDVWSFVSQVRFERFSGPEMRLDLAAGVCQWLSSNLSRKSLPWIGMSMIHEDDTERCKRCRSDVLKVLCTVTWALVDHLVDSEATQMYSDMRSKFLLTSKSCLICMHQVWASDPGDFVRALTESPVVQRRYLWTTRHLNRLKCGLNLATDQGTYNNFYLHLQDVGNRVTLMTQLSR
jgi:hypothetical protein